jgi:hypothetical protein
VAVGDALPLGVTLEEADVVRVGELDAVTLRVCEKERDTLLVAVCVSEPVEDCEDVAVEVYEVVAVADFDSVDVSVLLTVPVME